MDAESAPNKRPTSGQNAVQPPVGPDRESGLPTRTLVEDVVLPDSAPRTHTAHDKPSARFAVTVAVLAALLLAGCGVQSKAPAPERARLAAPDANGSAGAGSGALNIDDLSQQILSPKVPIPKEFNLVQVQNLSFNFGQSEEQLLVLKSRDNPDAPISVGVVVLDRARNQYVLSWTHPTLATNPQTFSVTAEDIIGDHQLEIICTGTNDKGEQTMDIFRKASPREGAGPQYTEIFRAEVHGTIQIQRHDRSQPYKLGEQNGTSFPILTTTQDPASSKMGDLVQTTYTWQPSSGTYVESGVQKLPGQQIADQRLNALYAAGSDAFDAFLSGPWYKTADATSSGVAGGATGDPRTALSAASGPQGYTLLVFDPTSKKVSFYAGDAMEIFSWENSYRTLYNSLVISAYNDLVPYIKSQISVAVTSPDTIVLYSPDQWAGTYMRLTRSMQDSLVDYNRPHFKAPQLSGEYLSDSGAILTFAQDDRFSLQEKRGLQSGGYELFWFGKPVLELRFINASGIVTGTKTYEFAFQEDRTTRQVERTIKLIPGRLGVHGFAPNGADPIHYVQVEELKKAG